MKKILIITISHQAKDVRLYYKLGKTLSEKYSVTILHNNPDMGDHNEEITLTGLNNLSKVQFLLQAAIQIKLSSPAVVIIVEPILLTLVNPTLKTKFVYDCHEFFNLAQKEKSVDKRKQFIDTYLLERLEKRFIPKLNACITVNDIITHKYQSMGANSITIPNYPYSRYEEEKSSEEKKYDFIYAGGLSPARGIKEIIQATFMLSEFYPKIKVLIIGKEQITGFYEECRELIQYLKLENNIDLNKNIPYDQVYQKYAQAKCGICILSPTTPRYKYALPIKLLEYLDAGLLVITNDFPSNKQIYQSSEGIFTAKFNAEDIANKMLKAITLNDEEIIKHQKIARNLIAEKYNWNIVAPKLMSLFEQLIDYKKSALLISYFFPPLGGAGVQRPLKIAKYAKDSEWQVVVLTIEDIVFHSYDASLLSEIESEVIRADSWDIMSILQKLKNFSHPKMGNKLNQAYFETNDFKKRLVKSFFFMDEKIGWFLPAVLKGIKQVIKQDFSAIIVTIYPPSSLLIALTISKLTNLPLFIDYRDHWTLSSYFDFSCSTSRQAYHNLEKFFLTHAKGIITIGEVMKRELSQSFQIAENKIAVSYNGFDEEDFAQISSQKKLSFPNNESQKRVINIGYIGNMYKHRTSKYFLRAVKELIDSGVLNIEDFRINFMGNYYLEEKEIIENSGLCEIINVRPQQEHSIAVQEMMRNDILLLLIASKSGKNVLTGKIFEYLRCKRPILGLVPTDGEAEDLLHRIGNPWTSPLEEIESIKNQLIAILKFVSSGGVVDYDISEYSRANQVKRLFSFIEEKL